MRIFFLYFIFEGAGKKKEKKTMIFQNMLSSVQIADT